VKHKQLNWEGGDQYRQWRANASRAVGGKYDIRKCDGEREWTVFYNEVSYDVEYRSRNVIRQGNTGRHLYYRDPLGVRHNARTLPEAMALAQADHDRMVTQITALATTLADAKKPVTI
jgi:hypothetical protein